MEIGLTKILENIDKDTKSYLSDGKSTPEDVASCIDKASKEGFTVIRGNHNTLLLDLDGEDRLNYYEMILPKVKKNFELIELTRYKSKSGKNWHVVLQTNMILTVSTRVALQAILGSDPIKEMLSLVKLKNNVPTKDIVVLFKPK